MEITGKIENLEPNPLGMRIANALRKLQSGVNRAADRPFALPSLNPSKVNVAQGGKLGDALFEDAQKEVENLAYGDMPMRMPEMSNIPVMKTGRKKGVADLMLLGMDAAPVANIAHKAAGRAVSKGLEQAAAKVPQGVKQGAREVQQTVVGSNPVSTVIKEKGGNWNAGALDFMLDALRKKVTKTGDPAKDDAVDAWLSSAMRKYFANEMGTPEDPIRLAHKQRKDVEYNPNRGMLDYETFQKNYDAGDGYTSTTERLNDRRAANSNRFEATELYRNEFMGREDPIGPDVPKMFKPEQTAAKENSGEAIYEDMADRVIMPRSTASVREDYSAMGEAPPNWLVKKRDEDIMYDVDQYSPKSSDRIAEDFERAGLPRLVDIMVDELRQGKITPERVKPVTVKQLADKQFSRAINEPEQVSKQVTQESPPYPGTEVYKDGSKWVEIPPGYKNVAAEGDIMGHCVGTYCTYIEKGQKKIISLRDAKGMPQITIDADGNMHRGRQELEEAPNSPGHIKQIMGRYNKLPSPEDEYKIWDFLRRTKPDRIGLQQVPFEFDDAAPSPTPEGVMRDRGLDVQPRGSYDDYNNLYGVAGKDQIVEAYDPFNERDLADRLTPFALDRNQESFDARQIADLLRTSGIEKQNLSIPRDMANEYYEMLRYEVLPDNVKLPIDRDAFFRKLNKDTDAPLDVTENIENLKNMMRALNNGWREVSPEEIKAAKRKINEFFGEEILPENPRESMITGKMLEFEDSTGYTLTDKVFNNPTDFRRVEAWMNHLDNAVRRGDETNQQQYIDLLRNRGYLQGNEVPNQADEIVPVPGQDLVEQQPTGPGPFGWNPMNDPLQRVDPRTMDDLEMDGRYMIPNEVAMDEFALHRIEVRMETYRQLMDQGENQQADAILEGMAQEGLLVNFGNEPLI
jgi:hypothetical protein